MKRKRIGRSIGRSSGSVLRVCHLLFMVYFHYLQKNANSVFFLFSLCYNSDEFEVAVDFMFRQSEYTCNQVNSEANI